MYIDNAQVTFTSTTFSYNTAVRGGGAVFINSGTVNFNECNFYENHEDDIFVVGGSTVCAYPQWQSRTVFTRGPGTINYSEDYCDA